MTFLRIVIITFLITLLAAFNLCHAHDHVRDNTILVLGDSLSAAYGIEIEHGWVNLLRNRLDNYSEDGQWNVVNASVSGETTAGGLARLPKLIEKYNPALCIIELGANNGLRGQSTSLMRQNLEQMVKQCSVSGTSLLLGIKLPPNYGERYTQAFHQVYSDVASECDISLVPFFLDGIALKDEFLQADRLHPTADAQPVILENVWPILSKALGSL
ncbi:MAG: arylesterase [Gammaproteobacteria bacterium]|nr:MAG: arylesterase [Gammaproteobacteria bacterium]